MYTTRVSCVTLLYRAIENTVDNIITATYVRRIMGKLDVKSSNNYITTFL